MALHAAKNDADSTLTRLKARADSNKPNGYAGEITSEEVHDFLSETPGLLVDVRTPQEWDAGMPDVSKTEGKLAAISWKIQPGYVLNPDFKSQFEQLPALSKDTPLFFMCKGGGRSLEAAKAMTAAGYRYCFNVTGGYEGRHDISGNVVTPGWKASLPSTKGPR